jgi:hypothetical protein
MRRRCVSEEKIGQKKCVSKDGGEEAGEKRSLRK